MQLGNTPFERSIASSLTLSSNLIISYGVNTQIYQLMREGRADASEQRRTRILRGSISSPALERDRQVLGSGSLMRPLEAAAAVIGIYTSMLFLTARHVREAYHDVPRPARKKELTQWRRPIDF